MPPSRLTDGLGLVSMADASGAQTYRLTDGLGSTVNLVDGAGNVTGGYTYDVFGAVRTHTGASTEYAFTGEQNDANGLEYLRARYYDNATGRFLGRDPLGTGYAYVSNNPANRIDPTGLYEICADDETWGYVCFDSTQVKLGACDAYDMCYIYTPDGNIPLLFNYGNACVFQDASIYRCYDGPIKHADLTEAVALRDRLIEGSKSGTGSGGGCGFLGVCIHISICGSSCGRILGAIKDGIECAAFAGLAGLTFTGNEAIAGGAAVAGFVGCGVYSYEGGYVPTLLP